MLAYQTSLAVNCLLAMLALLLWGRLWRERRAHARLRAQAQTLLGLIPHRTATVAGMADYFAQSVPAGVDPIRCLDWIREELVRRRDREWGMTFDG